MKKKSPQVKISKRKSALIGTALIIAGFAVLFFSIALNPKKTPKEQAGVHTETPPASQTASTEISKKQTGELQTPPSSVQTEKKGTSSGDALALAPRPSDKIVPAVPDSPKKPDDKPPPVQPPAKKSGKLIFIFDDAGNSLKQAKLFLQLPFPITIAVLPGLPESKTTADAVRAAGKEVFLHQPMQAVDLSINPGPGSIQPDMTTGEAARIVRKNIAEIGPIAGMNNHEGSLITADRNLIGAVLDVCIDEKIIFLDSRTSSKTQAPFAAMERGMHIWERDVFLDNKPVKAEMRAMIEKGLAIADKKGYAIMIGHVQTPPLAALLNEMYADLQKQGYVFTTLSRMKK
ncbi:divergent polysaccharide deacetylase family protein [Treponema sp. OMZ 840]|uniref:divergent polysaccharide deacetylase family protein n=1 Tax=Treponema sp. OMZ 840 TaxID=244313 RepID=UPI003D8C3F22